MRSVPRETGEIGKQIHQLVQGFRTWGITMGEDQRQCFSIYLEELLSWNQRINLISRKDTRNIALHHFLDSLSILSCLEISQGALTVDIGTGAGFPGLPLKICRPDILLTLVESTRKKTLFLQHITERLALSGVEIVRERAEDLSRRKKFQKKYDFVLARAVTPLPFMVVISLPFLKKGGRFIAYKGGDIEEEIQTTVSELPALAGRLEERIEVNVPISNKKRQLIIITKVNEGKE